jgi:hypothetical protein
MLVLFNCYTQWKYSLIFRDGAYESCLHSCSDRGTSHASSSSCNSPCGQRAWHGTAVSVKSSWGHQHLKHDCRYEIYGVIYYPKCLDGCVTPKNGTQWQQFVNDLYQPNERHLSTKIVSTFADRGNCVVSTTDPHSRIIGFLDRSRYYFFQVAHLYSGR